MSAPARLELPAGPPAVRQFSGGASNLTYLLTWGGARELVLRRPPRGTKAASAHDMAREHRVVSALGPTAVPVPRTLHLCTDPDVAEALVARLRREG